jgi:hypothetical protein
VCGPNPSAVRELDNEVTHVVGTGEFRTTEVDTEEAVSGSCKNILSVKYRDQKDICVLSSLHTENDMQPATTKTKLTCSGEQETMNSRIITDYNNGC